MQEFSKFSLDLIPSWSVIFQVKKQIRLSLNSSSKGNIDIVEIITSELLENAIKYGVCNSSAPHVNFEFSVDRKIIRIVVKNGIVDKKSLSEFVRIIEEIKNSNSPNSLYIKRLQELMNHPEDLNCKLGLYRILAYKGINTFNYKLTETFLEIKVEIILD